MIFIYIWFCSRTQNFWCIDNLIGCLSTQNRPLIFYRNIDDLATQLIDKSSNSNRGETQKNINSVGWLILSSLRDSLVTFIFVRWDHENIITFG